MASMLCDEKVGLDFDLCLGLLRALRGDLDKARAVLEEIRRLELE